MERRQSENSGNHWKQMLLLQKWGNTTCTAFIPYIFTLKKESLAKFSDPMKRTDQKSIELNNQQTLVDLLSKK